MSTQEIANRFDELAQQEKWFEIQQEFFAPDVRSIEPAQSPYFKNAEGLKQVQQKGQVWVKRIESVHGMKTTHPIVAGNHFAVGRDMDFTVQGLGRIQIHEIMLYETRDGKIVKEEFFY